MAGPSVPASLSRRRPPPTGDEEASSLLHLGEFEDTACLSVAECNVLLNSLNSNNSRPPARTDIYIKTKDYVQTFSRFKDQKTVGQVDVLLDEYVRRGLIVPFEKAQLGECWENLRARARVPGLL